MWGIFVSVLLKPMVEDVSGGRDPVGCQNQPAKGVQENQRYVDIDFKSTSMDVERKNDWRNLKKKKRNFIIALAKN